MSIGKLIVVAVLTLSCFIATSHALSQEVEKRGLSNYEKGEEAFLRHWYGEMLDDEAGAKTRVGGYLWEKWRAKRLAYISIVIGSAHGDGQATNYYVEPDKQGRWRIAVETVSSCCSQDVMSGLKKEIEHRTQIIGEYYIVSRMDAESGSYVPDKEKRKPESYTILLSEGKPRAKAEILPSNTHKL
ncbi:MAG: hypothetical protein ACJ741_20035 [Pyrinomonadaceae bacterium]